MGEKSLRGIIFHCLYGTDGVVIRGSRRKTGCFTVSEIVPCPHTGTVSGPLGKQAFLIFPFPCTILKAQSRWDSGSSQFWRKPLEANLCPEVENKLPPSLENASPLSSFLKEWPWTSSSSVHPHPSPSSPRPKKAAAWLGVARPPARRSKHHGLRESGSRSAPRSPAPSECGGSGWLRKGDRAPPGRARMRQRPRREWWGRS